ncbi:hypothetical protein B9Z55_018521 [Caenorhabditis nigoni]|nr:hypothetical protein B9Z55_018521 [Caenorhabditis nigoni]
MFKFELLKLGCTVIQKAFWRNRNARMQIRKQSQRLGYPSVVSIFQNLSKEKRHDLAEKNTFFNKLDNRTPYHLDFVGHIVFDTFLRSRKLCHLITIVKLQMYSFFFTTEYLPLSFRHWLRRKLDHNDGINRDSNSFFNRIGTVINYFFVKYNANSPDLRTTVPLMINNLIINFNIRDDYVPNFFKKLGQSIIRNLEINSETLLLYFYEEDFMQTVFEEMTTLTVQNVRVFALMVPPVSLERFWKMRAQTMELHDEFASRQCFINVCKDLRSGKVPFNRFQYTGYFRMTRDHFGGFWDRLKDRMGFGVDDDVRVNG